MKSLFQKQQIRTIDLDPPEQAYGNTNLDRYLVSSNDPYDSLVKQGVCANEQEAQQLMTVINKYDGGQESKTMEEISQKQQERVRRVQELKLKLGITQNNYVIGDKQSTIIEESLNNQDQELEAFQDDELSQILIQEDPQLLQDIINLLPQDDEQEKERIINMVNEVLNGAANEPSFSVHNRLYALAQAKQLGLVGKQESQIQNPPQRKSANPGLGHQLYQEHLEREQRQRTVQESQMYMLEQQRMKSKVNIKSNELAYNKLQKAIMEALNYVDQDGSGQLSYDQVGRLLQIMSIFKYSYSDDEKKINQILDLRLKKQKILKLTYLELYLGKRIMQEDEFLSQFWLKVNPLNYEQVDKRLIFEYLKLLYDPYIQSGTRIQEKEELMQECVNNIRQVFGLEPLIEDPYGEKPAHWSNAEIFMAVKVLTDNFSAAKIGGNGTGIKIPSQKSVKIGEQSRENLTFKPEINQRSELLEKRHLAKFIDKQLNHQNQLGDADISVTSSQFDRNNSAYAGKIISQQKQPESIQPLYRPQTASILHHQPSMDVSTRVNVLLEKDKMKQQKIRDQKQQKEANALKECTFKPQINKTSNHQAQQQHVHDRLWELSKVKRMNLQQENPSAFDKELEELQQCTFQPQINKRSKDFIEHKRRFDVHEVEQPIQQPIEQQQEVLHIKGYEETVNRLKRAKEIQEIKKQMIDKQVSLLLTFFSMGKVKGNNYGSHPTVQKPFNFHTEQQRQMQLQSQQVPSQPIIDVEITIGTGKVVHLVIREGDDIQRVIKNFTRTYGLNEATKRNLEGEINEYLLSLQQQEVGEDDGRDSVPLDQLYLERNTSQPNTNERHVEEDQHKIQEQEEIEFQIVNTRIHK